MFRPVRIACLSIALALLGAPVCADVTVQCLLTDGQVQEGALTTRAFRLQIGGKVRAIPFSELLSLHTGQSLSVTEGAKIAEELPFVAGKDRSRSDIASERIADLGVAALSDMLKAQDPTDTELRQPHPLYSLFARLVPAGGDAYDRSLDLVRTSTGEILRGRVEPQTIILKDSAGQSTSVRLSDIRRIAVQRKLVTRQIRLHSLRHSTQIEFLDTGIALSAHSRTESHATGITRLSFNMDIWAADPNGLLNPKPSGQKLVVDGFNFGALVGRVGAVGPRFLVGADFSEMKKAQGRLYLAINDNGHWQNNIGAYFVKLRITNAYDLGDPSD